MAVERESSFRPEIEGLRAVAATLVAVFHIWLGRVSGGVDVFFVVSSFLITTGLLGQVERTGRVDFLRFWGRLIRRLLPSALLVLSAVIIASVLFESRSRWKDTIEGVAASAVYLENWLLVHDAVDYLQQNSPAAPVQHFWALSVQGQFYLLWPFLFFGAAWLARRANVAFRSVLVPALLVVFTASLVFSIYFTKTNQAVAYFHTGTRVWEFCIGALLAVFISRLKLPNAVRLMAGWLGLLAIVSCGFLFEVSRVFPGYAALWPTVAGALVIIAGTTRGFGADKLLASGPMVYLGSISYGIYLWHFPLFSFAKAYSAPDRVSTLTGIGILAASVGLAALTQRFIEAPLRAPKGSTEPRWRPFALALAMGFPLMAGLGSWALYYKHLRSHARDHVASARVTHPGADAMLPDFKDPRRYDAPIYPGPLAVYDDHETDFKDPICKPRDTTPRDCVLGMANGTLTLAVVGGSHSAQWLPALERIAKRDNWRILFFGRPNCPFHLGEDVSDAELPDCIRWNENLVSYLIKVHPDAVFMTSTRELDGDEYVPQGYLDAWRALGRGGVRVIALRDNPKIKFDAPECVELHGADDARCSLVRADVLEVPSPTELLKDPPPNVQFVDLSDFFCDARTCPFVIGNVMVYRHLSHITATYVLTLEPMLSQELKRALSVPIPASDAVRAAVANSL